MIDPGPPVACAITAQLDHFRALFANSKHRHAARQPTPSPTDRPPAALRGAARAPRRLDAASPRPPGAAAGARSTRPGRTAAPANGR